MQEANKLSSRIVVIVLLIVLILPVCYVLARNFLWKDAGAIQATPKVENGVK